ncbi:CLUMA_CG005615, isoform A [Clunio marinus]|uniref:CLUMA_CG005615, isoform A n=1 Tax=Clunio marinus TaxID=568069 RepID=A0A1J1HVM1_9DIPT|nr:CLUMA_CG005615, isoform A [Clunio marinus]
MAEKLFEIIALYIAGQEGKMLKNRHVMLCTGLVMVPALEIDCESIAEIKSLNQTFNIPSHMLIDRRKGIELPKKKNLKQLINVSPCRERGVKAALFCYTTFIALNLGVLKIGSNLNSLSKILLVFYHQQILSFLVCLLSSTRLSRLKTKRLCLSISHLTCDRSSLKHKSDLASGKRKKANANRSQKLDHKPQN